MNEPIECIDSHHSTTCFGPVEFHISPDRDDMKAFPRCDKHWGIRLEQAHKTMELLSDTPADWFDPAYAGECWDEDY